MFYRGSAGVQRDGGGNDLHWGELVSHEFWLCRELLYNIASTCILRAFCVCVRERLEEKGVFYNRLIVAAMA